MPRGTPHDRVIETVIVAGHVRRDAPDPSLRRPARCRPPRPRPAQASRKSAERVVLPGQRPEQRVALVLSSRRGVSDHSRGDPRSQWGLKAATVAKHRRKRTLEAASPHPRAPCWYQWRSTAVEPPLQPTSRRAAAFALRAEPKEPTDERHERFTSLVCTAVERFRDNTACRRWSPRRSGPAAAASPSRRQGSGGQRGRGSDSPACAALETRKRPDRAERRVGERFEHAAAALLDSPPCDRTTRLERGPDCRQPCACPLKFAMYLLVRIGDPPPGHSVTPLSRPRQGE